MKAIDISKYQRGIDWKKVKAAGIKAVIIRAGSGSTMDPMFHTHINNAINAGLHVGVYWFSYAYTIGGGSKEAETCTRIISQYKNNIDLGVWFDWEYDSNRYAKTKGVRPNKSLVTAITRAFCSWIQKAGYMAGFYYNLDFKINFYNLDALKEFKKWYARYISTKPVGVDVWQYSSKGHVDGISGNVDMDIIMDESIIKNKKDPVSVEDPDAGKSSGDTDEYRKVCETKMRTIKKGSKGKAVKVWQAITGADIDGSFGSKTEAATKDFQKKHGLKEDGIVGVNTWRAGVESI